MCLSLYVEIPSRDHSDLQRKSKIEQDNLNSHEKICDLTKEPKHSGDETKKKDMRQMEIIISIQETEKTMKEKIMKRRVRQQRKDSVTSSKEKQRNRKRLTGTRAK
jgi:hypothetical protein